MSITALAETPATHTKLLRSDLLVIPLLALSTALFLFVGAEISARYFFAQEETDRCKMADPVIGYRDAPHCVWIAKAPEGPPAVTSFNECGYRTAESCGPVPPSVVRVAVLGSSTSAGYLVPYEESFAPRAASLLAERCHRRVEFQNLGGAGYFWGRLLPRTDEALRLHPNAMLLTISPIDLELAPDALDTDAPNALAQARSGNLLARVKAWLSGSRAFYVAQYFLLKDEASYIRLYLHSGDKADFMRAPLPPRWQARLARFDGLLAVLARRAAVANVPLLLAYVPQQAQADLVARQESPPGITPTALPRALSTLATAHGVAFVDMDRYLVGMRAHSSLFYTGNGHLAGPGHAVLATAVANALAQHCPGAGE